MATLLIEFVAMLRRASIALLTAALTSACATTYTPRPGPRLSMAMPDGKPAYIRDGRVFESGMFGSGLVDAVEGVPAAEEHARTFQNKNVTGFAATLAGLGLVLGGLTVAVDGIRSERPGTQQLGLGLMVGGLALEIVGAMITASAPPHQLDAINVYNDAVEERRGLESQKAKEPMASE